MPLLKYLRRLRYIDYLIRTKSTGNASQLAKKMNLSRSTALEYLSEMKEEGFPIKYDKIKSSYYYEEDCEIPKKIFLTREEMKKLYGGITFYQNLLLSQEESRNNRLYQSRFTLLHSNYAVGVAENLI